MAKPAGDSGPASTSCAPGSPQDTRLLLSSGGATADVIMIFETRNVRPDNPYRQLLAKVAERIIEGLRSGPSMQPGPNIDLVGGEDLFGLSARMKTLK